MAMVYAVLSASLGESVAQAAKWLDWKVGGHPVHFYINQMNDENFCNGCAMITVP